MAVERWWRRSKPELAVEELVTDPCPICLHVNSWYGDGPVKGATHGAGGPDGEWRACWDHYKVIAAHKWIGLTKINLI